MEKENVKKIIVAVSSFLAGTAVGSIITYLLTKSKLDKDYAEQVNIIRRGHADALKKEGIDPFIISEDRFDLPEDEAVEVIVEQKVETKVEEKPKPEPEKVKEEDEEDDEDEDDDDGPWPPDEYEGLDPFLITPDEYGVHRDPEFVFCNLYYRGKGLLYDDNDQLVDIANSIGYGTLETLKSSKDQDPYIYVRNPRLKIDYEVLYDVDDDYDYLTPKNTGADHPKEW